MKNFFPTFVVTALLSASINCAQAQSVGINTTPNATAALHVSSTTKGILIPGMSTTQRNSIASANSVSVPATGLMVYDNTLNQYYYYNGTIWTPVGGGTDTYPNVELSVTNTSQQTISATFSTSTYNTLTLSSTNSSNASLSGGNTWNGSTFTVGSTGAGWYQITGQFVGVASGSNGVSNNGYQVILDKNGAFSSSPATGNAASISTYNSTLSSTVIRNASTVQIVVYLAAADYLNFRAQAYSTSASAYTSTDGSTNIQIVRLR